jgi:hypothetical protein
VPFRWLPVSDFSRYSGRGWRLKSPRRSNASPLPRSAYAGRGFLWPARCETFRKAGAQTQIQFSPASFRQRGFAMYGA